MMFSRLFAPDTPEWLVITVLILSLVSMIVLLVWAMILETKYTSPFTIIKTSNKEKWHRATILALIQTAIIPILGLAQPTLSPHSGQFPMFSLFCGGVWIVVFPIAVLYKRWEFERHIKSYRYFDKQIKDKNSVYNRTLAAPFRIMTRFFITADQKRFFSEGFPDDIDEKKGGESLGQESNGDLQK